MTETRNQPHAAVLAMRLVICTVALCLAAHAAHAAPYGNYDARHLFKPNSQGGASIDATALDRQLADLRQHAGNYPPIFDSSDDAISAKHDVTQLIGMMGAAVSGAQVPPELLLRMGMLGAVGHNLDVAGAAAFAQSNFEKLLKTNPQHMQGNLNFGIFLSGTNRAKEAVSFLTKAKSAGLVQASYALGMTYLALNDKAQALVNLRAFQSANPDDLNVAKLIEAIQSGKLEIRK